MQQVLRWPQVQREKTSNINHRQLLCWIRELITSLNSASFGSMKNILLNWSGIVELWFLDGPSLFCFLLCRIGHKFPNIWPHIIRTRNCLFPCESLPGPCVSFWWLFLLVERILWILCMHQILLFLPSTLWVGNFSSLGMYSLALGSTWWRYMISLVTDQKSFLASASSRVESSWSGVGEESPSDSPRRTSCSSPRSRRSRVKVDVIRRCPLPRRFWLFHPRLGR